MRNYNFIILILVCTLFFNSCNAQNQKVNAPDIPRLEVQSESAVALGKIASLKSKVLNKTIPLSIHLPANYDRSKKTYPVLYMLGSDYRARFAMLASTLDYMGEGQIPEMILIGVDIPEGNRILLPTRENQDTTIPDGYIKFFETELIPYVDNTYRTASFKALYGGSNSGFFSIYTLLNNPLLFNGYLASSPSLSHIPEVIQQKIKSGPLQTLSENRFLHIIYSDDEDLKNLVSEFSRVLTTHKPKTFTYKVDELVNQGHVPAMDFTKFLLALYPDFNPYENLDTLDKVTQHFKMLSKRYGYEMQPPISVIFNLGADMIRSKNLVAAEKIFQYSLQVYPEAKESYLGIGVVRRDQGQLENAKLMFEKALIIDSDYSLAKNLLQRLNKPKSSPYTIAYGSNGICLTNIEGTATMRLTDGHNGYPAWSPDGKRIAFYAYHDGKKTWSIHTINTDGTNKKRLTHAKNKWDSTPSWSRDGKKILFAREYKGSEKNYHYEIWIMNADGSDQKQIKPLIGGNPFFTPDGRIVFSSELNDNNNGIYIADVDGKNLVQLTSTEFNEWHPKVSPDGKQIAFSSDRDGNREIYVMNIDGSNQKRLTNNNGPDGGPSWSPDGSQLVFQSKRGKGNKKANLYIMNKDGSSVKKITTNSGWQPAWFKSVK